MPLDKDLTEFSTASPVLTTFDFIDVADGTGIIRFLGASEEDDSAKKFFLDRNATASSDIATRGTVASTSNTKVGDWDFDLTQFNLPRRLKGRVRIWATMIGIGGTNDSSNGFLIFKLRKFNGSTETEIGSVQTVTVSLGSSSNGVGSKPINVSINVSTEINFATGDILRLTVEAWAKLNSSGGSGGWGIAHDPKGRQDTAFLANEHSSVMEALTPFSTDI